MLVATREPVSSRGAHAALACGRGVRASGAPARPDVVRAAGRRLAAGDPGRARQRLFDLPRQFLGRDDLPEPAAASSRCSTRTSTPPPGACWSAATSRLRANLRRGRSRRRCRVQDAARCRRRRAQPPSQPRRRNRRRAGKAEPCARPSRTRSAAKAGCGCRPKPPRTGRVGCAVAGRGAAGPGDGDRRAGAAAGRAPIPTSESAWRR